MIRVLHVVGSMNIGGTETMLMNVYRAIDRSKVQFDFISYCEEETCYDREIKAMGGRIIHLKSPKKGGAYKSIKDLCRTIKQYGPYRAIHCHTSFNCGFGVFSAFLCGVKIRISHSHTTGDNGSGFSRKAYRKFMKILIRIFSSEFAACSSSAGSYLFTAGAVKGRRYIYVPNYIPLEKFMDKVNCKGVREELNIKPNEKLVGHIGTFKKEKNHKFLIKVIQSMVSKDENIRCVLVGDGPLRGEIEEEAEKSGLKDKIYFLGQRIDIPDILKTMDAFIFPSIYEGLGLVLLEAQACGVPCVVSEAIQPEADLNIGLLRKIYLSKAPGKWADAAFEMMKKPQVSKELIKHSFENKGYNLDNILSILGKLYQIKDLGNEYEKGIDSIL